MFGKLTQTARCAARLASRFGMDRKGQIAILAALVVPASAVLIGVSVDLNRVGGARLHAQELIDAAALAAGRNRLENPDIAEQALKTYAQSFINAQLGQNPPYTVDSFNLVYDNTQKDIDLTLTGHMPTTVAGAVGMSQMTFKVEASAIASAPKKLEVALVLDTSESMAGDRIASLKTSAQNMVNSILKDGDGNNGNGNGNSETAKMAVIPFGQYVNVGTNNVSQSWISVPTEYDEPWSSCSSTKKDYENAGCYQEEYDCFTSCSKENPSCVVKPKKCKRWACPTGATVAKSSCSSGSNKYRWYGCVKSRAHPDNLNDANWNTTPVQGFLQTSQGSCPKAITPLTSNKGTMTSAISTLSTTGTTYIPTGLVWGWRVLSSNAPFSEGANSETFASEGGRKALVLMSDGANTQSRANNGMHTGTNTTQANTWTAELCESIKLANIEMFVVAYGFDENSPEDDATLTMLRTCASDERFFFTAANAAELEEGFDTITSELQKLRLTR